MFSVTSQFFCAAFRWAISGRLSTQIEHMHPWTTLVVPERNSKLSLDLLPLYQDRLITGFGIYNTMRHLMVPATKSDLIGIPPWSYNLLQQTVQAKRSCLAAKIPPALCPCNKERNDMGGACCMNPSFQLHTHSHHAIVFLALSFVLYHRPFSSTNQIQIYAWTDV